MARNNGWGLVAKVAGLAAGAYGVALAAVWANQERMIFKPDPFSRVGQSLSAMRGGRRQGRRVREWVYKAPDGISIQGFLSLPDLRGSSSQELEAVVYLGGIREESSWALARAGEFGRRAFVCMNYRGYGLSEGRPAEAKILEDCACALRMLVEQGCFDGGKIHLIGRSLGSGVAGYLSSRVGAVKTCLLTPYDSVLSVASKKYWFLPVGMLMRHPFDAIPWARQNDASMMMVLAEVDVVVPHAHSQRLFSAWRGSKSQVMIAGADHSSIVHAPGLFEMIAAFFDQGEGPDATAAGDGAESAEPLPI
jgi:pimeloyl-ACP methyl ester carboxylesterase